MTSRSTYYTFHGLYANLWGLYRYYYDVFKGDNAINIS